MIADLGAALEDAAQRWAPLLVGGEAAEREERPVSIVVCEVSGSALSINMAVVEGQCDDLLTNLVAPVDHVVARGE